MIECVDSIVSPQTTGQPIPSAILTAPSVLGYNHGNSWPTYGPYALARPDLVAKGWLISTTLTCLGSARCYDIEAGGGQNKNIGIFMKHADRSHGLPILYTFASNVTAMTAAARSFGYQQGRDYFVLSAHPNSRYGRHLCSPRTCGYPAADGTQYQFAGPIDRSVLSEYMLAAKPKPKPKPKPPKRASGIFVAELHYDHDKGKVAIYGKPGQGVKVGDVNETINLQASLKVGPKTGTGQWHGKVEGASPR